MNSTWEVNSLPNIKSAKKRVVVTSTKTLQNKMQKSLLKTNLKKFKSALSENKDAKTLSEAYKNIDKAVAKGLMHKNAAARKKSQLAAMAK